MLRVNLWDFVLLLQESENIRNWIEGTIRQIHLKLSNGPKLLQSSHIGNKANFSTDEGCRYGQTVRLYQR